MIFQENFHTHTVRCHHAKGTEREYIEAAIEAGIRVLGFSDHTPYTLPREYTSPIRMSLGELDDYFRVLEDLREEYKNDIELHIGLEIEYYPKHFHDLCCFLKSYPLEYALLAMHYVRNEYEDLYSGRRTGADWMLKEYVDQAVEGMRQIPFLYFAHPDLLYYTGDERFYEQEMRRLCEAAKEIDLPLEINGQGIWMKRNYPNPLFWKIAGETGNKAVFGSDAHSPEKMYVAAAEEYAQKLIFENHLETVGLKDRMVKLNLQEKLQERV